jgi:hypothetical protein
MTHWVMEHQKQKLYLLFRVNLTSLIKIFNFFLSFIFEKKQVKKIIYLFLMVILNKNFIGLLSFLNRGNFNSGLMKIIHLFQIH